MSALGEPSKSNPFLAGGILYPCTSVNGRDTLQSQLANDSRLLWATLTPHGTRHFISDYPGFGTQEVTPGHYEVVDYRAKSQNQNFRDYVKRTPIKVSFLYKKFANICSFPFQSMQYYVYTYYSDT